MQVSATTKFIRVQPRKVRIVADEVRGKPAEHVTHLLRYHRSKGAQVLRKTLLSAMANAESNHGISADSLRIATITVDEGPRYKRMIAKAQGRGCRILKKTSHITVVVEEFEGVKKVKAHGTKAKPRPSFAAAAKAAKKAEAKAAKATKVEPPVDGAPSAETLSEEVTAETTLVETPAAEAAPVEEHMTEETTEVAAEPADDKGAE
jgi:large subunit ribosomal protein L22